MNVRSLLVLAVAVSGCTTDVGQPTFMPALSATMKDPEVLKTVCKGRAFETAEANAAPNTTKFTDFTSSRSMFGEDGTGQVNLVFTPRTGEPCLGHMTFSFHQETAARQYSRRNIAYSSTIELNDVVVTAR